MKRNRECKRGNLEYHLQIRAKRWISDKQTQSKIFFTLIEAEQWIGKYTGTIYRLSCFATRDGFPRFSTLCEKIYIYIQGRRYRFNLSESETHRYRRKHGSDIVIKGFTRIS